MPQRRPSPGSIGSIGQAGKQSFDRVANLPSHDGTTAKTGRRHRVVVKPQMGIPLMGVSFGSGDQPRSIGFFNGVLKFCTTARHDARFGRLGAYDVKRL
jgi:hypothetical protein